MVGSSQLSHSWVFPKTQRHGEYVGVVIDDLYPRAPCSAWRELSRLQDMPGAVQEAHQLILAGLQLLLIGSADPAGKAVSMAAEQRSLHVPSHHLDQHLHAHWCSWPPDLFPNVSLAVACASASWPEQEPIRLGCHPNLTTLLVCAPMPLVCVPAYCGYVEYWKVSRDDQAPLTVAVIPHCYLSCREEGGGGGGMSKNSFPHGRTTSVHHPKLPNRAKAWCRSLGVLPVWSVGFSHP